MFTTMSIPIQSSIQGQGGLLNSVFQGDIHFYQEPMQLVFNFTHCGRDTLDVFLENFKLKETQSKRFAAISEEFDLIIEGETNVKEALEKLLNFDSELVFWDLTKEFQKSTVRKLGEIQTQYLGYPKPSFNTDLVMDSASKQKKIFESIINNDFEFIKKFCSDGNNQEKFIEFMMLGIDPSQKTSNDKGRSALLIAAKNGHIEIVKFIIEHAMKTNETQQILAEHLLEKTQEGKNVLHESTTIPNNEKVIMQLCQVAKKLSQNKESAHDLANYVDLADDNYGSSALHFSCRRGAFSNYVVLREAGANPEAKANNEMIPIQVLVFLDPEVSIPFMKSWLTQTHEGQTFFKKHYTCPITEIAEPILNAIIKMNLDSALNENSQAQISAFKEFMRIIPYAKSEQEFSAILASMGDINFLNIHAEDLTNDDSGPAIILKKALEDAASISDQPAKDAYIRAKLLSQLRGISQAQNEAFNNYGVGSLLQNHPQLVLDGLYQIETNTLNKDVLAKRLIVAISYSELKNSTEKSKGFTIFGRGNDKFFSETVNQFLIDLREKPSMPDMQDLIAKLADKGRLALLKQNLISALNDRTFFPKEETKHDLT